MSDGRRYHVMVTGQRRSGTTLMANLLDAQPGVRLLRDFLGIERLWRSAGRPGLARPLDPRAREAVIEAFRRQNRRLELDADRTLALDELAPSPTEAWSLLDLHRTVLEGIGDSGDSGDSGDRVVGHKTTGAERILESMVDADPLLRVVYLVRDPRDVAVSAALRFPDEAVLDIVRSWRAGVGHVLDLLDRRPELSDRLLRVDYEDLVSDPDGVLVRIGRALGLAEVAVPSTLGDYGRPWTSNSSFAPSEEGVVGRASVGRHLQAPRLSGLVEAEVGPLLGRVIARGPTTAARLAVGDRAVILLDRGLGLVGRGASGLNRRVRDRRARIGRGELLP